MNKIFRIIWSHSQNRLVVISEAGHSRTRGKQKARQKTNIRLVSTIATSLVIGANGWIVPAQAADDSGTGNNSVALGTNATASNTGSVAIGNNAYSDGNSSTAIGSGAEVKSDPDGSPANNAVAIGHNASSNYLNSTAIGDSASVGGINSMALGSGTYTTGNDATAIGTRAQAAKYATAFGEESAATNLYDLAAGYNAKASGGSSGAVGFEAQSLGNSSYAFGNSSKAQGDRSLALGSEAGALGGFSIGEGYKASATNSFSTAIGPWSSATGNSAVALGSAASGTGAGSTALGNNTTASGADAFAGGAGATAGGDNTVAVGPSAHASDPYAVAIGNSSTAAGQNAISMGSGASAQHDSAIALGGNAQAQNANATALGSGATAANSGSLALGYGANASNNNSVALGSSSTTASANPTSSGTVGGTTYQYAGTSPSSVVSVGSAGNERQITNVAAGRVTNSSTDAINGSQLYATNQAVDNATDIANKGWNVSTNGDTSGASNVAPGSTVDFTPTNSNLSIDHNGSNVTVGLADNLNLGDNGSITTGGTTLNNDGLTINNGPSVTNNGVDAGGDKITNVAAGTNPDDAVNVSQLGQQGTDLTNKGLDFAGDTGTNVHRNLGQTVSVKGGADNSSDLTSGNIGVVADGNDTLNVQLNKDVDLGNNGSVTAGNTTINQGGVTTNNLHVDGDTQLGDTFEVHNGGETTYNGPITNGDDITNKNYVDNTVQANKTRYYSVNDHGQQQANYNNDGATGTNALAAGVGTTAAGQHATAVGNGASAAGDSATAVGDNANASGHGAFAGGQSTVASGDDALAMGNASTASGNDAIALGHNAVANNAGSVALGSGSITAAANPTASGTVGGTTYQYAGTSPSSVVSVGSVGNERQITNVAAGRVTDSSTDAINGSQLYATNQAVDSATNTANNANKGWNVSTNGDTSGASNVAPGDTVDFTPTNNNLTVSHNGNNISLGLADNLNLGDAGSVAMGNTTINSDGFKNGNTTVNGDGLTIEGGPSVTTNGVDAGGSKVTNVADGDINSSSTDAVNGSQLWAVQQSATAGWNLTTNGGQDKTNIAPGGTVDIGTASGEKNLKVTQDGSNVQISMNKNLDLGDSGSVQTGNTTVNNNGVTIAGGPSMTTSGIDAGGDKITGVADGDISQNSSDAVNGSQLWDVEQNINNVTSNGTKYFHANSNEADSQANGSNSVAIGPEAVADGASSIASGEGATAKGASAVATGAHSSAEADNATALGAGADAKTSGGVALGANSVADRSGMDGKKEAFSGTAVNSTAGAVSVGSQGNERQITNVAGGTADTDAVNVRQLSSVQQGAVNYDKNADGTTNYNSVTLKGDGGTQIHNVAAGTSGTDAANVDQLDELGNNLVHRLKDVKQDANAGTASALAAANLPQSVIPGKSMVSAGAGTYQGQSAVSVGLSRLSDNGRVVFKGSLTGDTQGHFGAGVGVGWQW